MAGNLEKRGKNSKKQIGNSEKQKGYSKEGQELNDKDLINFFEKYFKEVKQRFLNKSKKVEDLKEKARKAEKTAQKRKEKIKEQDEKIEELRERSEEIIGNIKKKYSTTANVKVYINRDRIKKEVLKVASQAEEEVAFGAYEIPQSLRSANITCLLNKIKNSNADTVSVFYDKGTSSKTVKKALEGFFDKKKVYCFPGPGHRTYHQRFIFNEFRGVIVTCRWEEFFGESSKPSIPIGVAINKPLKAEEVIRKLKKKFREK